MSTPMHFRKRQLLEYQHEISLSQVTKPSIQFEYPSSPSSLDSGKTTPVDHVTTPDKSCESIALECSSNKLDVEFSSLETYTEDAETMTNEVGAFVEIGDSSPKLETVAKSALNDESATFVDMESQFKLILEATFNEDQEEIASMDPKPSTLLLAKLNQYKEKSIVQSKSVKSPAPKGHTATSSGKLKAKRKRIQYLSMDDLISIDAELLKEKGQLVIQKENFVGGVDEPDDNDVAEPTQPKLTDVALTDECIKTLTNKKAKPVVNRIYDILTMANIYERRMDSLVENGFQVHAKDQISNCIQKIEAILKTTENQQPQPLVKNANEISTPYIKTPTTSKLPQPSTINAKPPNKPDAKRQANFIHITADTTEEDFKTKTPIASEELKNEEKSNTEPQKASSPSVKGTSIENKKDDKYPYPSEDDENQLVIGPNRTVISKTAWSKIDWSLAAPAVTRKILMAIFDRDTLATHSLTGRPSPAFKDLKKPEKKPLDSAKVADTVYIVTKRINATPKEVRMAITTKCADECKMLKWREQKKPKFNNKENKRIKPY